MKRSEALAIIWDAINELENADHILTKLEEAGMLPPASCTVITPNIDRPVFYNCTWEPEND